MHQRIDTIIIVLASFLSILFVPTLAFGHTSVEIEQYEIEVGWSTEPPIVGYRNDFIFQISEIGDTPGVKTGVKNAFKNLEAIARFGGVTKSLDINSDPIPGHYFSPAIPTRTGTITIDLKGEINGISIDISIPVEDVESTAILDFPPTKSSGSNDVGVLKNAISSIQKEISQIKSNNKSTISNNDTNSKAYDFAVFGMWLDASGVVLSVVAMIKRR